MRRFACWIDGVRKRIDEHRYQFASRRKPQSIWSAINVERVRVLKAEGGCGGGLKAYSHRHEKKSKIYAYEQKEDGDARAKRRGEVQKSQSRMEFFEAQPRSYRHRFIWRIVSASAPRRAAPPGGTH